VGILLRGLLGGGRGWLLDNELNNTQYLREIMAHTLDYQSPPKYKTYKKRAEKRFKGQKFLSQEEFNALTAKPCNYCDKSGPNGIDRIDNNIGYIVKNCVPCCKHCNYVKGDLSQADFEKWTARFVKKQSAQ
jgi:hypothetical protein